MLFLEHNFYVKMKLIIKLIKNIAQTDIGIYLRNTFGISPRYHILNNKNKCAISISDAFPWRTDSGFKTTFKFADILDLFFKIKNSYVEIQIFSKENELIKTTTITDLSLSNEFLIDKNFIGGLEDYGVFYIYHRYDGDCSDDVMLANKCYVGFSINDSLSSFAHGNLFARSQGLDGENQDTNYAKHSFFKNNSYRVQSSFEEFIKTEFFLINPTSKTIHFSISNRNYSLKSGRSLILALDRESSNIIKSNCMFFRPYVFNYKNNFLDVYHS